MSNPFEPGSVDYYRKQVEDSKKRQAEQSAQNQAIQKVSYEAFQAANLDAQKKAIETGQPQTVTQADIEIHKQNILDTKYAVPSESPDVKAYAVPIITPEDRDNAVRAGYSEYQKANLQAQRAGIDADKVNKIRQNYETFKQKQSEAAGGGVTAYGERLPVEYRVDLDDSLSGIIPGKMHYSVDLQDRLGGKGGGKKKPDASIGGQLKNVGGYLGEQTAEAIDLLALGSAGKGQAAKASKDVKEFTGYDESNAPVSPIKAGVSGGKVLIDRLVGKDDSGDLGEFNRNLSGAAERPIEFGANTGVDVLEFLVGSKGSKSAAKTAVGLADIGKSTKGAKDVAGVTLLDDTSKLGWLPQAEAARGGDVARSSFEAKPATFKRQSIDLSSGIGKAPEAKPFESLTIDLGKGTGKAPKKFKNTMVDLGRGVGEFVDLGKADGSLSDISKDFGGTVSKPKPKPKPSEVDNGNGSALIMEEPTQVASTEQASQVTEQAVQEQSQEAKAIYAELDAAQTVDLDALQIDASSLGIGNSTAVVTARFAKKNKAAQVDFQHLRRMQEVSKSTGKTRNALLTELKQQGKQAKSGKERQALLLERQITLQGLQNIEQKPKLQRKQVVGVGTELVQGGKTQAVAIPKLDNILKIDQTQKQSQRTVSRTVLRQSSITIPKLDIPTRTTPTYDVPLIPKVRTIPNPPGPKPIKFDVPKQTKGSSIDLKLPGGPAKLDFGGKRKAGKDAVDNLGVSNILFPALDIKVAHPSKGTLKRHGSGGMFGGTQDVPFSFDVGKNALFGPPPRKGKSRKSKKKPLEGYFNGLLGNILQWQDGQRAVCRIRAKIRRGAAESISLSKGARGEGTTNSPNYQ